WRCTMARCVLYCTQRAILPGRLDGYEAPKQKARRSETAPAHSIGGSHLGSLSSDMEHTGGTCRLRPEDDGVRQTGAANGVLAERRDHARLSSWGRRGVLQAREFAVSQRHRRQQGNRRTWWWCGYPSGKDMAG